MTGVDEGEERAERAGTSDSSAWTPFSRIMG